MTIKITQLHYQRNGTRGTGFYHCFFRVKARREDFLATFETDSENETTIIKPTCRVVSLDVPTESWDGEEIAYDIEANLKKQLTGNKTFFDLADNNY